MKNVITSALVAFVALTTASVASAVSLTPNADYKEIYVNFERTEKVTLTVQGERYRSDRARTMISIKEVTDGLFIVEQDNLYYPAVMIYPPLPVVTMRDAASLNIEKGDRYFVRVLVPANLQLSAARTFDPGMMTCMAYWTGFIYNSESDSCQQTGTSGCSNPFEFRDLNSCEVGNLLK